MRHTHAHPVKLVQLGRVNQRICLKAGSYNGDVTVQIPDDFEGSITWTNGPRGSTIFSPDIQSRLQHVTQDSNRGKAFLLQDPLGHANEPGCEGDELIVSSVNGKIRISFTGSAVEVGERYNAAGMALARVVGEEMIGNARQFFRRVLGEDHQSPRRASSSARNSSLTSPKGSRD